MRVRLTEEQKQMVLDNQALVGFVIKKYNLKGDFQELFSLGTFGLVKAVVGYDKEKAKFTTYAIICIRNEIFMSYRDEKKGGAKVSIDEPIRNIRDDFGEITLKDVLADLKSDFLENILRREDFIEILMYMIIFLENRQKSILLYQMGNKTQYWIAKRLAISQSYVSRVEQKAICKIKELIRNETKPLGYVYVNLVNDGYEIIFYTSESYQFNNIFARTLKNVTDIFCLDGNEESVFSMIPSFKVICDRDEFAIWLPSREESFIFLAEFFRLMPREIIF